MSYVGQTLNITCLTLVAISVAIFWSNKQLQSEIAQLTSEANTLRIQLENIHQTCKDKVVGAFPRIPATHIVTHSDEELQGLEIETNVTFILLYFAGNKGSLACFETQIESITDSYPNANIFKTVVSENTKLKDTKTVSGVKLVGVFQNKADALNKAIEQVESPYFLVLHPDFIIEPKGSDTGIEWLHHALVITPGVYIIGGSVLLSNNELVVPCYSINLCNWTITQKYEYKRSFGEIMICDEVSHSFMARKDIISTFGGELFDKNLVAGEYMFVDFFLRAKKLDLTTANRPEVLFVQKELCAPKELSNAANMDNAIPFARKHQVMQFKDPNNKIHSLCDASTSNVCTTENIIKDFNFPNWYESGMFAYPFVVEQAIHTLEIISDQLGKAEILFALRGETLFGAVMTKSVLPWGRLNSIQLSVFGTKTEVSKFAATNGYEHKITGDTIMITVKVPGFSMPIKVDIVVKPSDKTTVKLSNIQVNGKLYPVLSDPISELKKEYGDNYLGGEDGKTGIKFSCKLEDHHACLPAMPSRGASTYQENYCEI